VPQAIASFGVATVSATGGRERTGRSRLSALLRPPAHRGPLIAAGAVVFTTGLALAELRLGDRVGVAVHLLVLAAAAGLVLGLGLQARAEDGRPPAYQSVLLVTGLLLLYGALLRLADLLGADFGAGGNAFVQLPAGALVWTSMVLAAVAAWTAFSRRSAVALLIAALALGIALVSTLAWLFDAGSQGPYRVLLLVLAAALALGSLVLRGSEPRHAEQLVNAGGVAILMIPLIALAAAALQLFSLFGGPSGNVLPNFWELVVLGAGCGLIAYGAVDHVPGAAYLGLANLVAFVVVAVVTSEQTLLWWPLLLILIGLAAMGAGLRPLSPLPPEPDPYRAGEQPLAARADEEITLRVRDDSPPT
jgi:hypothetical protein